VFLLIQVVLINLLKQRVLASLVDLFYLNKFSHPPLNNNHYQITRNRILMIDEGNEYEIYNCYIPLLSCW